MTMRKCRRGAASSGLLMLAGLTALALLGVVLFRMGASNSPLPGQTNGQPSAPLMLYCAAGLRAPIEQIAADYRRETGVQVQLQFGGSNTLLSQIEIARTGDLFLAADDSYLDLAREKKLLREALPLATMRAVIVVPKDNPKQVSGLEDLLRPDVRTALANPGQAAIGKVVREVLQSAGKWTDLEKAIVDRGVFQPTVSEVANSVKVGAADAGIVWNTTVFDQPDFAVINPPEFADAKGKVALGVLEGSLQPTAALQFGRYVTARDKGLTIFKKFGYEVIDGDDWSLSPELTFYCGSVNRRAVEPLIVEFEQREGVRVNTVYNGCGILVGQMKVIADWRQGKGFPDTYMACDRYYLDVVKDQFQDDVDISETEVVIAVRKGNPQKIQNLNDLVRHGLRVAVGQPQQCTIGVLTRNILKDEGIEGEVLKNVVAETCSSALLLPMVATGSVDAAMVYETDTRNAANDVDVIRIASPAAKAIQPFSIARSSSHKWLSRRFFDTLARHQDHFEAVGFRWKLDEAKPEEPIVKSEPQE